MKRSVFILGILGITLVILFAILIHEPQSQYDETRKHYICIINPSKDYYWGDVRNGIETADEELGCYTKFRTFDRFDLEEQVRLLKETSYIELDGIITIGEPNSDELNEQIRAIVDTGIPVVLLDTDSPSSNRSCYIGTENYQAGQLAAQTFLDNREEDIHAVIFTTSIDSGNQSDRINGFQDTLSQISGSEVLEICETLTDKTTIQENLKRICQTYPDLNAIFCAEAATSQQIGLFLDSYSPEQKIDVIAFDLVDPVSDFIRDGTYLATIYQNGLQMGYQSVAYLSQRSDSSSAESASSEDTVFTDVICVTKENLDSLAS